MIDSTQGAWLHDLIKPKDWHGQRDIDVTWMQPKLDGWRVTFFGQSGSGHEGKRVLVFGKKQEADLELSHLLDWHETYQRIADAIGPGTSIDGELYVPGKPASCVTTAMREKWPMLVFKAFSVPWDQGIERACPDRDSFIDACQRYGVDAIETSEILPGRNYEGLLREAKDRGIEGWVLKGDLAETHRSEWWKIKVCDTIDLVLTQIKPGKGKYHGLAGALHGSVYFPFHDNAEGEYRGLSEVSCTSGMNDELRASISDNDLGRVFEVEYDRIDSGGRLRHPRFLRWRDDKPARECTSEQLRK